MLGSRYLLEMSSGLAKDTLTFNANKVSFTIATTDTELGGLNFLSFSSWFKTLSTCLSGLIVFAESNNQTRVRAWASGLEKDVKAFVSSSKDCKRVCANFESVLVQILVIT